MWHCSWEQGLLCSVSYKAVPSPLSYSSIRITGGVQRNTVPALHHVLPSVQHIRTASRWLLRDTHEHGVNITRASLMRNSTAALYLTVHNIKNATPPQ